MQTKFQILIIMTCITVISQKCKHYLEKLSKFYMKYYSKEENVIDYIYEQNDAKQFNYTCKITY